MSYKPASFLKTDESSAFSDALYGTVAEIQALAQHKPLMTRFSNDEKSFTVRFILNGKGCESFVLGIAEQLKAYADADRFASVSLQWNDGVGELELSFV